MADDQVLQTVPVIVTNFTDIHYPQDIQDNLRNITDGVKTLQDIYGDKNKFKEFEKRFNSLSDNIKNIWDLLRSRPTPQPTGDNPPTPTPQPTPQPGETNPDIIEVNTKLDNIIELLESILNKEYCKCNGRGSGGEGGSGEGGRGESGSGDDDGEDDRGSMDSSLEEALRGAQETAEKNKKENDGKGEAQLPASVTALVSVVGNLKDVVVKGFADTFNKWDEQIKHLKDIGVGAQSAAELNRITSKTMWSTEELVEWNVSINDAIKSTNAMMAAGMNPNYVRENNRQFIMGLTSVGLQLQPDTIKEFGNAVFDATHVKELTQGWAQLINPNTENAISADELSRYLGSDEYKQMASVIMRNGEYNTEDIQREMQIALTNAVKAGFTGKDALSIAQLQTQARLGGGAFLPIPGNANTLIGAAQTTGTFTDLKNISDNLLKSTKVMQSDFDARRRVLSANAGLAASGDFTFYNNLVMNDGHTRRIATKEEVEQGQYEGFLPRVGKNLASLLPGESLGSLAQQFTGDSSFITQNAPGVFKGLFKDVGSLLGGDVITKVLLGKIERNTAGSSSGLGSIAGFLSGSGGSNAGVLGKIAGLVGDGATSSGATTGLLAKIAPALAGTGPIALILVGIATAITTIVASVANIVDGMQKEEEAEKKIVEYEERVKEAQSNELSLKEQYNEAKASGDDKKAAEIQKLLLAAQARTDQEILELSQAEKEQDSAEWQKILGIAGPIASMLNPGFAVANIAQSFFGVDIAGGISGLAKGSDESYFNERRKEIRGYAEGGLITEEQQAIIGEKNNPELILPLTNPDRVISLLKQAQEEGTLPSENWNDKNKADIVSIVNSIIAQSPVIENKLPGYENGGLVTKEQQATIGEKNNPELILPLTNPNRTEELLKEAVNNPDTDEEVSAMLAKPTYAEQKILFNKAIESFTERITDNPTLIQNILPDLMSDLLESSLSEDSNSFRINLENFNPFGIKDQLGELKKYDNMELGITEFVSSIEKAFDRFNDLSYSQQLQNIREKNLITQDEYDRVSSRNKDKLVESLNELNRSVQESNRISRNSRPAPSLTTMPQRRY